MNDMNNPAPNAYDVLRDEHTALQTSFAHLSKQVNEVILERCNVSDDLREVRGALRRANEDLHTAETERDETRDALAKMHKRFDNLVADCNGTTISLQQERDKNAVMSNRTTHLERTIKELEAVIGVLKKRDEMGDDDIACLQDRVGDLNHQLDAAEETIKRMREVPAMPDHIPTGTDVWVVDTRKVGITRGRILKTMIIVFSDNSTVISYTINGINYDAPSQCVFTDIASAGEYMAQK